MSLQTESSYILITGATSDIGRAIAFELSGKYNLLLHGRNADKLQSFADELKSSKSINIWQQDLKSVEQVSHGIKAVLGNGVVISGFIHCAAAIKILPIKNFRSDYYKEIFDVNVFSAIEIIKSLVRKPNIDHFTNVIFISAYFSKFGDKGNSLYAASKGAIDSLVKSLAVELAPAIRVNSILPGAIRTKMTSHLFEDENYMIEFNKKYLLGEGTTSDIANMVSFLLSTSSSWITGQNFQIDGGASSH